MIKLPKIALPAYDVTIPSTGLKTKFRPMVVKDEKILLMAKESGQPNDIFKAVEQIVNNSLLDDNINVKELTLFDIEYLFIKVRSVSVGSTVSITYVDDEDNKEYEFNVNLDEVIVKMPEKNDNIIELVKGQSGIKLKYPVADIYYSTVFENPESTPQELFDVLVEYCLDQYFDGDTVINFKDVEPVEILEFVNGLDVKTYGKIRDFIDHLPTVFYEIKYGKDKTLKLTSLTDFFSF